MRKYSIYHGKLVSETLIPMRWTMKKTILLFLISIYAMLLLPIVLEDMGEWFYLALIAAIVFGIISVVLLFKDLKNIYTDIQKQNEINNLAIILKVATIPVYIYMALLCISLCAIFFVIPGLIITLPVFLIILGTYVGVVVIFVLFVTSSFTIANIYIQYKNGWYSQNKFILHTILQLIIILDILDSFYLFFNIRKNRQSSDGVATTFID